MTFRPLLPATLALVLAAGATVLAQDPMQPPEGVPVGSDWLYSKHYEQVQGIMKETDLSARVQKLENFTKKLPAGAKMSQFMQGFFGQVLQEYQKAGKTAEAQALQKKMVQLFPNSDAAIVQQFQTAFQNKDYPKAIEFGEKIYAGSPNPQTAVMLAQSYIAVKNGAKASSYSEKALQALGPKQGLYFAVWLGDYYVDQRNTDKAASYYKQALDANPGGAPQGWTAEQWSQTRTKGYLILGADSYAKKDYAAAARHYSESLKYSPQNDSAHLYLGLSQWRQQQLDEAMASFARAVVLNKPNSAKAREYLEQIYKPRNNNSLDGIDKVLDQARKDLKL